VGERRLRKVLCYRQQNGKWIKAYETDDPERLQRYELPYHAAAALTEQVLAFGRKR
jgi:hypothetical protein